MSFETPSIPVKVVAFIGNCHHVTGSKIDRAMIWPMELQPGKLVKERSFFCSVYNHDGRKAEFSLSFKL